VVDLQTYREGRQALPIAPQAAQDALLAAGPTGAARVLGTSL
jgi:hypothetical protein